MSFISISKSARLACALALLAAPASVTAAVQKSQKGRKSAPARQTEKQATDKPTAQSQQKKKVGAARQINSSITISWRGQPGVERYRLQVATSEAFDDILFDLAVTGLQHTVSLPSGNYFWRVAPAVLEAGAYTTPQALQVVGGPASVDDQTVVVAQGNGGWSTATGEFPHPIPARLRSVGLDLVGVNRDGTVYAIDGMSGVALWTARYNPSARRGEESGAKGVLFNPLILSSPEGRNSVVVAFAGGIRVLRGETGSELWRASFPGAAMSGIVGDVEGDGKQEIVALTSEPSSLVVLNGETGRIISNTKLEADAVGAPALLYNGEERGIVVALNGGTVEVRKASGESLRSVKLDTAPTTGPLVVSTSRALLVIVGIQKGLAALSADQLQQLGLISTSDDSPRGTLTASDLDGDGFAEIVMVTRAGRVALISTTDGKIKWVAEGARDADSTALADLNGDGVLDVIAAAGPSFAHGYSGKDGSLIWKVEEGGGHIAVQEGPVHLPRSLVIATSSGEGAFLVGGDPGRVGLRAVELPKGAVKTAAN